MGLHGIGSCFDEGTRKIAVQGRQNAPVSNQKQQQNLTSAAFERGVLDLQQKRAELLASRDWVGLEHTKPVKIHFDSIEDKNLIGKRRRVDVKDQARNTAGSSKKRPRSLRQTALQHPYNAMPSTQDISVHIGSSVRESASTLHAPLKPAISQQSVFSEEMLLDQAESSLVSLDRSDQDRTSYLTRDPASENLPAPLPYVKPADKWRTHPKSALPFQGLLEDLKTGPRAHGTLQQEGETSAPKPQPRRTEGNRDDRITLKFATSPRESSYLSRHQTLAQPAYGGTPPLMHGALLGDVEEENEEALGNLQRVTHDIHEGYFNTTNPQGTAESLPSAYESPHTTANMDSMLKADLQSPGSQQPESMQPGKKLKTEGDEAIWRRFVFGSQESFPTPSRVSQPPRSDTDPSSYLVQPTSTARTATTLASDLTTVTPRLNHSTEALASSPEWTVAHPGSLHQNIDSSTEKMMLTSPSPIVHAIQARSVSAQPGTAPDTSTPPQSKSHNKAPTLPIQASDSASALVQLPLSPSTQAIRYVSTSTISSDELGRTPSRIEHHLIYKRPKRYEGWPKDRPGMTILGANNNVAGHARRLTNIQRPRTDEGMLEDQIKDW